MIAQTTCRLRWTPRSLIPFLEKALGRSLGNFRHWKRMARRELSLNWKPFSPARIVVRNTFTPLKRARRLLTALRAPVVSARTENAFPSQKFSPHKMMGASAHGKEWETEHPAIPKVRSPLARFAAIVTKANASSARLKQNSNYAMLPNALSIPSVPSSKAIEKVADTPMSASIVLGLPNYSKGFRINVGTSNESSSKRGIDLFRPNAGEESPTMRFADAAGTSLIGAEAMG